MCGIAGFIDPSGLDHPGNVRAMLDRIGHRGPDDYGLWCGDEIGLGQVRLSIIDPGPRGHQPFVSQDGLGILSYNGEIYNFQQLRAELEGEGITFHSHTDTEVLLYALHQWGPEQAISKLNGMFAFAYHDRRDGSLWLARDRMGIKPLYVTQTEHALVFASEMKALFAHPQVTRAEDEQALMNLVLYERFEGAMTPYRDVHALVPGTLCRIAPDSQKEPLCSKPSSSVTDSSHTPTCQHNTFNYQRSSFTYFDLLRDIKSQQIVNNQALNFEYQTDRCKQLLRAAVNRHLISDVPVATMCSGGLDSGLVTAFAREINPKLVSYVADVESMNGEEARRARLVCDALGVELRVVDVSIEDFLQALPSAIQANDQPLFFSQGVASLLVAQQIQRDGFKVVLTGDGADELFGGYSQHALAYRSWQRRRLHAACIGNNRLTRWLGKLHPLLMPIDLEYLARDPLQPVQRSPGRVNEMNTLLLDGARRHLREARLFKKFSNLPHHEDRAFLTSSFEDIYVHLREHLRTVDCMSMHESVENRVPFLDNELIEFALHLPVSAKYYKGSLKRVIRHIARQYLPREIIDLPKLGFNMKAVMWEGLLPFLSDGMLADLLKWSRTDLQDILELLLQQPDYQFHLLAMELWLRMNFNGDTPEQLSQELLRVKRAN